MKKKMLEKLNERITTLEKRFSIIDEKWDNITDAIHEYEKLNDTEFNEKEYHRLCEYNNKIARVHHELEDLIDEYKNIEKAIKCGR